MRALAVVLFAAIAGAARAQDFALEPAPYKPGEVWPETLVHGADFLEPFLPVAAAQRGDAGRIVLGSALPWGLLAGAFAAQGSDRSVSEEIRRPGWNWCGVDQSKDNYPFLFGLVALGGLSSFLPAPEDAGGWSIMLRLDRLTVFALSVALANAEVELFRPVFDRTRPNGRAHSSRPSGHAASAFSAMAFMSDVLRDTFRPQDEPQLGVRLLEELASALPYLGGFYMALERVHGGKHFLSDALLGGALGVFTTQMLYEWSFLRQELGHGLLDSLSLTYVPGGFELAWERRF